MSRETFKSKLTLAVLLVDDFTGEAPIGDFEVSINQLSLMAQRNISGYYLFVDQADRLRDEYLLEIKNIANPEARTKNSELENYKSNFCIVGSDLLERIQPMPILVGDINQNLQNDPVVRIALVPNTAYPFANGETLIRGIVQAAGVDSNGNSVIIPVAGAKVQIWDNKFSYDTDERGDFVFYFKNLKNEDIVQEDQKKFIKMGSDTVFDLNVSCEGFENFARENLRAEFGKTTTVNVTLVKEV